jgi:hypothetical protein
MEIHGANFTSPQEVINASLDLGANGKKLAQHNALQLICLDYLQWLRNGRDVAEKLHCSQSCVSRQSRSCLDLFGLKAQKRQGEIRIDGNMLLLKESRRLHQLFRVSGLEPIRVEASQGIALAAPIAPNRVPVAIACTAPCEPSAIVHLLHERVIDMWIDIAGPNLEILDATHADGSSKLITFSLMTPSQGNGCKTHLTCLPELSGTAAFEAILSIINQR